jgi:dihydropteroate synthase
MKAMSQRSLARWEGCGRTILPADDPIPRVMGILNLTPDSFSDGGRIQSLDDAIIVARSLASQGADMLDLGGESSRPGAEPVSLDDELNRVIPVVAAIAPEVKLPLSIDTTKAEVARQAVSLGAVIINDITALQGDPRMARVAADTGAAVVLMHMQGVPKSMQENPQYGDVVAEVYEFLEKRVNWAVGHGIPRERIAIDPGIGFGKTNAHSIQLLRNLDRFDNLGCAVLIGNSRKGFLGKITGRPITERATATAVSSLIACLCGARVVRVHDVGPMVDAIKIWTTLRGWEYRR